MFRPQGHMLKFSCTRIYTTLTYAEECNEGVTPDLDSVPPLLSLAVVAPRCGFPSKTLYKHTNQTLSYQIRTLSLVSCPASCVKSTCGIQSIPLSVTSPQRIPLSCPCQASLDSERRLLSLVSSRSYHGYHARGRKGVVSVAPPSR